MEELIESCADRSCRVRPIRSRRCRSRPGPPSRVTCLPLHSIVELLQVGRENASSTARRADTPIVGQPKKFRYQTPSRPISTGRFRSNGAVRKCSSMSWRPASMSGSCSGPMAIIVERPMAAVHASSGRPTQSQNSNMLPVSIPKPATPSALVDTATKWRAMAASSPRPVEQPVSSGVGIGHRLEGGERLGGDDEQRLGGIEVLRCLDQVGRIDVGHETELEITVAVVAQGFVGHHRPEIGPTDADIDHRADPTAGVAEPGTVPDLLCEVGHPVEHAMDVCHDIDTVDDQRRGAGHAKSNVEHGAVLRHVDVFAGEHGVDPTRADPVARPDERVGRSFRR